MQLPRLITLALLALALALLIQFDLEKILSIENFKANQSAISLWLNSNYWLALAGFFTLYIGITALSIPGAALMSLIAGALFGTVTGTLVASFASTIGASLAFLLSRYLFQKLTERKLSRYIKKINKGIRKEGNFYLFAIRLVPLFPFFVINAVMGLTRIPLTNFYWVSQLGMFPATLVFVNAGTQISNISKTQDILSWQLLSSFLLLGIFPLITKRLMNYSRRKKEQRQFKKPANFENNLVVIGAGSAGLVTAYIASQAKAKVTLIERAKMGGDCLNTGCVPSKALIRSSKIMSDIKRSSEFGISTITPQVNLKEVMQRVMDVISQIEPHDSTQRYSELGVNCIEGNAVIRSPWTVEVNGKLITTRSIVIATGGNPSVPNIPGLSEIDYLTSENIWGLEETPENLLVIGGGAIGCEMSQAFKRLGSNVTIVETRDRLLAAEDDEASAFIEKSFIDEGIKVITDAKPSNFSTTNNIKSLTIKTPKGKKIINFDSVLIATGRLAETNNLGLEDLGIKVNENGTVQVNNYLQTIYPSIYACGDAVGSQYLTHAAAHEAWHCAMNSLYGHWWRISVDSSLIPHAIFCDPEVAAIGLNEASAKKQNIKYEVTRYEISDLDRAIIDNEAKGFIKVLTIPGSDKILGVTIVGTHAGENIHEYVLAMQNDLGLNKILGTIHIYPTFTEGNKYLAGNWRKANLSKTLIKISSWLNNRRLN
ncbi:MAG: FAD-dependent oxidoreductase [Pseudomonadota bacterium]|nr:FAD-dependent oxidoreductase [Pseudomonadota bacterium]